MILRRDVRFEGRCRGIGVGVPSGLLIGSSDLLLRSEMVSQRRYGCVSKTPNGVVVDHSDGLHEGITGRGSDKPKASSFHVAAQGI